ncbi:exonuclease SbcCD subunit D [Parafrankia sp. BMG5.11]|uniref:exonuclease SbcCD subunit D n=1 Tax=Parafrankia sp. BMG5.11 TaxID=222540 RepID=UPI00103FD614|nr:exonuclease SbcCD subunit D [Parafrankia sp. BMG5.11]TCJ41267.1 exonuclease SbcCD subunit D [Parafrankia sp. BMG5.11]
MRILHTSDWHLGRQFNGISLEEDHQAILDQVLAAIDVRKPDVLIIAGDIFDRAAPPASAVRQLNNFVKQVWADTSTAIVMIAGNHDSGDRVGAMGVLAAGGRALISGPLDPVIQPLIIQHESGPVAFSALSFGFEYAARECFGNEDINCPEHVLRAQMNAARAQLPPDCRWVVTAHAYVEGARNSESERSLGRTVGGIETVAPSIFEGADYVALGHLHRPQTAGGEHIRYSGSPLAFGFDESEHEKSMTFVELAPDGSVTVELLPFTPLRQVRTLRGKLSELLASKGQSNDFVKVILTDASPQIDAMKRMRQIYPNAVQLNYETDGAPTGQKLENGRSSLDAPQQVVAQFLGAVRSLEFAKTEQAIVDEALNELAIESDAA